MKSVALFVKTFSGWECAGIVHTNEDIEQFEKGCRETNWPHKISVIETEEYPYVQDVEDSDDEPLLYTEEEVRELLSKAFLDAFKIGQVGGTIIDINASVETYLEEARNG